MKKAVIGMIMLAVVLVLVSCSAGRKQNADVEECDQTVTFMVYMIGSDLESKGSAATNDLAEMEQSGVDLDRVNVLVYTGGCKEWHNGVPTEKNTVLRLTENGFEQIEEYDILSMGDPESLSRFLKYCSEQYPADAFELVLWDHGSGPVIGYGSDTLAKKDGLTLPEIRQALEQSPFDA